MLTNLIIIRGNSGSGKSTLAKALRSHIPDSVVVSQDTIRRDIMNVKDTPNNLGIGLLMEIINYCDGKCHLIILEGILKKSIYENVINELAIKFHSRSLFYYFDLTLNETYTRHQTRDKAKEFGFNKLSKWFLKDERLTQFKEYSFFNDDPLEEILMTIYSDLNKITYR